jgi:hypothetical protein
VHALSHVGLVAGITWDPFIRGLLILVVSIVLLPGSVYLVLATDTGARLGFLLVGAGLTGLVSMMAVLWLVLASTAAVGRPNSWKPLQVVTGDYASQVTIKSAQDFPVSDKSKIKPPLANLPNKHWYWPLQECSDGGWHVANPAKITDPESAADSILGSSTAKAPQLKSPFSSASDYIYVGGYEKGINSGCLFAWNRHKIYLPFARSPHLAVIVAQPVVPVPVNPNAAPPKPRADTTKPFTYVILERNLGSVRQPQFVVAMVFGIVFLIFCSALHRRDKEIWARQAAEREAAAGAGPADRGEVAAREPVGASR